MPCALVSRKAKLLETVRVHLAEADRGPRRRLSDVRRAVTDVLGGQGVLPQGRTLTYVSVAPEFAQQSA